MDVKAGATVGFASAVGLVGGAVFGSLFAGLLNVKDPAHVAIGLGAVGALVGAFAGGTLVAPDAATAVTTTSTGTAGLPRGAAAPQLMR